MIASMLACKVGTDLHCFINRQSVVRPLTTAILDGTTEFAALRLKASGYEHYFY